MLLDGKLVASQIQREIQSAIAQLGGRKPCLAVIIVGDNPASQIYVARKTKACEQVGIESRRIAIDSHVEPDHLIQLIEKLNLDPAVDGILLQLPLPDHLNPIDVLSHLSPEKDVDGLHPINLGKLLIGEKDTFTPCTPLGIKTLLEYAKVDLTGMHALILGRSNIVGKPMAAVLIQNTPDANATVTIAHSRTKHLKELCLTADIIIACMGSPKFIKADMVKEGAIVIDVGINRIKNPSDENKWQVVGDVDFDAVKDKCSYITSVPGGVGPMTIAMLLSNTLKAYLKRFNN